MKKNLPLLFLLLFTNSLFSQTEEIFHLNNYSPNEIFLDSQYIWIATNRGVVQRQKSNMSICNIWNNSNSSIDDFPILKITKSPTGETWIASEKKVFKFDGINWVKIDTLSNAGIGFRNDDSPIFVKNELESTSNCVLLPQGMFDVKRDFQGNTWFRSNKILCGGSGGSGVTCTSYYDKIFKFEDDNITVEATNSNFTPIGNYEVGPDGSLFYFGDGKIHKKEPGFSFFTSTPVALNWATSLYFSPDSTLWIIKDNNSASDKGVYFYKNNVFSQDSLLTSEKAYQFRMDENGEIFGWDENGVWKKENNQIGRYPQIGIPTYDFKKHFSNKKNMHWSIDEDHNLVKFDGENVSTFYNDSISYPSFYLKNTHCDGLGNAWILFQYPWSPDPYFETHLYKVNNSWEGIDTSECGLLSYSIAEIFSDSLGEVWFIYSDTVQNQVACKYDGMSWTNFESLDIFLSSKACPQGLTFVGEKLIKKNGNNGTDFFEFPDSLSALSNNFQTTISEDGTAWLFHETSPDSPAKEQFYFDGNSWKWFSNPYGYYYDEIAGIYSSGSRVYIVTKPSNYGFNANLKPQINVLNLADSSSTSFNLNNPECDDDVFIYHRLTIGGSAKKDGQLWLNFTYNQHYGFTQSSPNGCACPTSYSRIIKLEGDTILEELDWGFSISQYENENILFTNENDMAIMNDFPPSFFLVEKDNSICEGAEVIANILHGKKDYAIEWEDGQTEFQRFLNNGNHDLTLTDQQGNANNFSILINSLPLEVQIDSAESVDGTFLQALPSGGTPPYSFAWNSGSTTDTIHVSESGEYFVTITDANNCEIEDFYSIQFLIPPDDIQLLISPNPANQILHANFSIKEAGFITTSIVDTKGIELLKERFFKEVGEHEIDLDISNLNAGLYIFSIQFGAIKRPVKFIKLN